MSRCANEEFGCCQSPSRQAYRRHYAVLELNHIIRDIEVNNEKDGLNNPKASSDMAFITPGVLSALNLFLVFFRVSVKQFGKIGTFRRLS